MNWAPPGESDLLVRVWMERQGWPVSFTLYDIAREVYVWRHEAPGGNHYTLRVAQMVLDDRPAAMLIAALDSGGAAAMMSKNPTAYTWVKLTADGIVVEQRVGPPNKGD